MIVKCLDSSDLRETRNPLSFSEHVRVWSVNECKLKRRKAKLEPRLANSDVAILMLQETWLCEAVGEVRILVFYLDGRLDRTVGFTAGGDASIFSLSEEFAKLQADTFLGIILAGDVNIHHRKWLRHSRESTAIGKRLWNISRDAGLKQLVSDPTCGDCLLDIVRADVRDMVKVSESPSLANHRVDSLDINVNIKKIEAILREVWNF